MREERLSVGGTTIATYVEHDSGEPRIASQRRFLASPDGKYLAYTRSNGDAIAVRDAKGHRFGVKLESAKDFRFTADSKYMVASSEDRLLRVRLRDGDSELLAMLRRPKWIEVCRDGVAVLQHGSEARVRLVRWSGAYKDLAHADWVSRLMASKASSRLAFVTPHGVSAIDLSDKKPRPKIISAAHGHVGNGEMSDNGKIIAWSTENGLFIHDKTTRLAWIEAGLRSLWLRDDTVLAASTRKVKLIDGRDMRNIAVKGAISTVRFGRRDPGSVVIARDRHALLWKEGEMARVIGTRSTGRMLGAEHWAGGVALWSSRRVDEDGVMSPE